MSYFPFNISCGNQIFKRNLSLLTSLRTLRRRKLVAPWIEIFLNVACTLIPLSCDKLNSGTKRGLSDGTLISGMPSVRYGRSANIDFRMQRLNFGSDWLHTCMNDARRSFYELCMIALCRCNSRISLDSPFTSVDMMKNTKELSTSMAKVKLTFFRFKS